MVIIMPEMIRIVIWPVPPRPKDHKTDRIFFVYLVIVLSNMYIWS